MQKKKEEAVELKQVNSKDILGSVLKEFDKEHLNFQKRIDWNISSGSLLLDTYLGGGIKPSLLRICGHNNEGKSNPVWEKVLTPSGWKTMGELKQGSLIIGSDGKAHQVLQIFPQGKKEVFKVTFSDETSVFCCGEHLWTVKDVSDRENGRPGSVRTTNFLKEHLKHKKQWNFSIQYVEPVHFQNNQKKLQLHPYVLGVMLGDGHMRFPEITTADEELIALVSVLLPDGTSLTKKKNKKYSYYINSSQSDTSFQEILRSLNLFNATACNKFIPKEYLLGSVDVRTAVLQGLLDTDGSVFNNRNGKLCSSIEYTTCSGQLAEDVLFLSRSLGARATIKSRLTTYTYLGQKLVGKLSYRIRISFHNNIIPFRLSRKLKLYHRRTSEFEKYIVDISPHGTEECVCIKTAAPDSLYVSNGFNLTHNTPQTLEILRQFLITVPNSKGLWVVAEGRGLSDENKERCGIKFVYSPEEWDIGTVFILETNIYELFINTVKKLVKNNIEDIRYCFVVDSIDGLMLRDDSKKEISDDNMVAGTPKLSKKMLQSLSLGMFKFGHLMILISQVTSAIKLDKYEKQPNRGGDFSGGNSLLHAADWIMEFQKTTKWDYIYDTPNGEWNPKNPEAKTIGKKAKVAIMKAAIETSRYHVVEYPIKFGRKPCGVWLEKEMIDKLIYLGLIVRKASWLAWEESLLEALKISFPDVKEQIQGEHNMMKYLEENPKIRDFLYPKTLSFAQAMLSSEE